MEVEVRRLNMVSSMKRYSLLLCIVVLVLTGCSVFTRKEPTTDTSDNRTYSYPVILKEPSKDVQVRVTYGLNHYAKIGKDMRVKAEIQTGTDPYEGYLQIEVPIGNSTTKYNQEISVESNSYVTYELKIPVVYENMKFRVNLLNNEQVIQTSQMANVEASRIYDVQYIGVLDEELQSKTVVSKGKMQVFQLNNDELEDAYDNLNLIDCILINEDEIEHLDESKALKLEDWLQNGGTIMIEQSHKDNGTNEVETEKYAYNTGDFGFGRYIFVPKMKSINELTEYVENLGLNPKLFLSGITDNQVKDSINADVVSKVPNILWYVIVFLLYILVIGPVLYFILKKTNRRTYYWGVVPVISVIFLVGVYGLGKDTRVWNSYLRYVTITQIAQNGYTNDTTYFAAVNPDKSTLAVEADTSLDLQPLYTMSDNYQVSLDKTRANIEFSMNVENTTDEENLGILRTTGSVASVRAFQPTFFKTTMAYPSVDIYEQETQPAARLTYANYKIAGTYTNTVGMDLQNACIVSNQTIVWIGDLASGETVELEDCQYSYIPSNDMMYTDAVDVSIRNLTNNQGVKKDSYIEEDARFNLMQYTLNKWTASNPSGNYLIGFTKDSQTSSILSDSLDAGLESSAHLVIRELDVDYNMGDGYIFLPTIKQYMSIVNGDYYKEMDMIESDRLTVDYNFGQEDVRRIEYSQYYNTEFYVNDANKEDLWLGFYGTIYFYNRRTGEYDKVITSGEETVINQLDDYLDDKNVLRVRYEVSQNSVTSNLITIPKLTAIIKSK